MTNKLKYIYNDNNVDTTIEIVNHEGATHISQDEVLFCKKKEKKISFESKVPVTAGLNGWRRKPKSSFSL